VAGTDDGADLGALPGWRWDVALSFASAQRDYVWQVATALQARGVRCFYDADEQIELWGRYLAEELPSIYAGQAAAVVVFVSAEYAAHDWTRLERRAALSRAVQERREYVLPARFDDTQLPGLLSDMVTVDLRTKTPQQFAAMIAVKLAALGAAVPVPSTSAGDPARDTGAVGPAAAGPTTEADQPRPGRYGGWYRAVPAGLQNGSARGHCRRCGHPCGLRLPGHPSRRPLSGRSTRRNRPSGPSVHLHRADNERRADRSSGLSGE
jgi:hypothetical protein